ncbi:MAG: multidrug ABC transporter substrate-binding protein [Bacteroidetes bacterium GWF2_42_66]|nr:MAG: multidrug ABC transporter substrate-binding protein [Bacteroidetes bacterium GWA2_42_15]OFY01168.1 MAG: multidrug ABC transporter substrate-binding protein [Bacteroidetes bacterium GWE2_42_39]OFY42011.1 MAG: multidrug ABC transporter substrate-binding protein [Bacteroidetes bacterium GWF2_42_66]HBL77790.1 multidrug ABC transporter substrate-binding protein [Prolixibacteraceae bacterium]HCR89293.1 multidrug ABC transporter substrate-binding protein [Prolixibacteraceae bacterium]
MNYTNTLKIATNALRRNKFRAFLTMLGIIIGVASVIAMLAIGQGSKKSIQDEMSGMGTNMIFAMPGSEQRGGVQMGNSDAQSMKLSDVAAVEKECTAISAVSSQVSSRGQVVYGNKNWPSSIYGVNEKYLDIRKYALSSGRIFSDQEVQTYAKVCLIGQTIIDNLFEKGEDPIGKSIRFNDIPIKVIGILEEKGENGMGQDQDDIILSPYTTVQKRILSITHIQGIFASAVSEDENDLAIEQLTETLRRTHKIKDGETDDFRIRSQSELVQTFTSISDMMTTLLGAIAGISLLVGGIGIMNIMYVSVTERTKEIGLRLSVGGRGTDIMMQFLVESIMLSISGGVIGILLGILASYIVSSVMNWPVVIMTSAVVFSFIVCSAIGIFFGWYPARKAASLNPIDALRYE